MLTSSTQLQNRSFHVVERTRTSTKCQKMKNARAKRAKILFFIVKYANLWGFCCRRRRGCLSSLMLPQRRLSRLSSQRSMTCIVLHIRWQGWTPLDNSHSWKIPSVLEQLVMAWTCCPFGFKETDGHTHGKLLANKMVALVRNGQIIIEYRKILDRLPLSILTRFSIVLKQMLNYKFSMQQKQQLMLEVDGWPDFPLRKTWNSNLLGKATSSFCTFKTVSAPPVFLMLLQFLGNFQVATQY